MKGELRTKRIAFFDWDGTLSADGRTVSAANIAAIAAFREAGNIAVLCTGRCLAEVAAVALSGIFDGMIIASGTMVLYDPAGIRRLADGTVTGECFYRNSIPTPLLREILDTYEQLPEVCCKLEGETGVFFLHPLPGMQIAPHREISSAAEYFESYGEQVISKATTFSHKPFPPLPVLEEKLTYVRYPHWYQEICLPGETKSAGIRRMIAALGLPHAATVAFGDSENDRDMLTYVACGVAMSNATAEIRAIADRIAPPVTEEGLAPVLLELTENT